MCCGRTVAGSVGHVITKFSGTGRFIYPWCSARALRARSSATTCRVVFDASAYDEHEVSLNDCILSGPALQPYALRYLWRDLKSDDRPRIYKLQRLAFGVNCSPFLAIATVQSHATKCREEFPDASREVLSNM